jgi:hypothetical protein
MNESEFNLLADGAMCIAIRPYNATALSSLRRLA